MANGSGVGQSITTRCCVVGGGPAGMMTGVLLARAGVDVVVLEKHGDFLRDFRGDTIHPSTLELMHELGWLDDFLKLPHQRAQQLVNRIYGETVTIADFSHLPVKCPYIALMPQWDFLDFLAARGKAFPSFDLRMNTAGVGLIESDGRITGVQATGPDGPLTIHADLVIACDGRHTLMRERAGMTSIKLGAPIDVLWFRIPHSPDDVLQTGGYFDRGHLFVTIDRNDYWQCGDVIPKGGFQALQRAGIDAWRTKLSKLAPQLAGGLASVSSWDQVSLLSVEIDRMPRWWRDGLLFIGDAAHAMSPVGGVGINLAVQDAVATANLLAAALRENRVTRADLAGVQSRREWPVRVTQRLQVAVQNTVFSWGPLKPESAVKSAVDSAQDSAGDSAESSAVGSTVESDAEPPLPIPMRLMRHFPLLRRLPARLVGMGIRPEHITEPPFSTRA